jgi:hypothetical protein
LVLVRFGGDQVVYGGSDVLFRLGGWMGNMGVEETVVGRGVGEGVSDLTSYRDFAS